MAKTRKQRAALFALVMMLVLADSLFGAITVQVDSVLFTLSPYYHGVNYSAYWDDLQGDTPSRDALRRAKIQIIRFPGGVSGNTYDWRNALAAKMTTTTPDMLNAYAKAVGAKVLMQTKWNDSAASASGWVADCKSKGNDVPLWEVGNEPELEVNVNADWDSVALRPYYTAFNAQAPAMKVANSAISVMGCSGANVYYWVNWHTLSMFLQRCSANADAVSLHYYVGGGWDAVKATAQSWPSVYNLVARAAARPVYITEWSCIGPGASDAATDFAKTIGLALANADLIGAYAKSGVAGHCMFGCIHQVDGAWGILCGNTDYRPPNSAAPSFFILPMWTAMGNIVLKTANTADAKTEVSAYAHKKPDGSIQVMLINKSATARNDTISFSGFNPTGRRLSLYELKSSKGTVDDFDIYYNGQLDPEPASADLPVPTTTTCAGSSFTRVLPPYSISMLDFAGAAGVISGSSRASFPSSEAAISVRRVGSTLKIVLKGSGIAGQVRISIIDNLGRTARDISVPSAAERAMFDVKELAAGTYLARVVASNRSSVFTVSF